MKRKPAWLVKRVMLNRDFSETGRIVDAAGLNTVCAAARCPNQHECYSRRVATFMILGDACTRQCRFCAVSREAPRPVDPGEPERVAAAAAALGLRYVVITSVTRDDLPDGGAAAFCAAVRAVHRRLPGVGVEVLTPDFRGQGHLVRQVAAAGPAVYNHNLETVPRLYPRVRPGADYRRSLDVLATAAAAGRPAKSGLMLGLGESAAEVAAVLDDLRAAGCLMLTLGQYLSPGGRCLPVERYVPPGEFDAWAGEARARGFAAVAAGPFVRSSHFAGDLFAALGAAAEEKPSCSRGDN